MDIPQNYLKKFKKTKVEEYQDIHTRLTSFYGRNCHWLCYKFPIQKVRTAFYIKEKEKDEDFSHLLQTIKTL